MGLTRISDVGRWTTCEAWAMAGRVTVVQRKPVAAWVGTMAHQFLAGGERASDFKQPSRHSVAFDSVTPLPSAAISQARDVAIEAEALLDRYGLKIFDSELSVHEEGVYRGVVDMLVMDRQNRAGVLDLKTGRTIGAAWLQLGGYLSAWKGVPLSFAGIVHVPRTKGEPDGTIIFRDPDELVKAWKSTVKRVEEVLISAEPTYSPGTHCSRCPLTSCAVRMEAS